MTNSANVNMRVSHFTAESRKGNSLKLCKSMDWFPYDKDLLKQRVKKLKG